MRPLPARTALVRWHGVGRSRLPIGCAPVVRAESPSSNDEVDVLPASDTAAHESTPTFPASSGALRFVDAALIVAVLALGVVARLVTTSPMWLDEALTVNISRLPLSEIPGALRHDGHPPLYYFLSHVWMQIFGTSDTAIRALAGVFGVAAIPLVWLAARRIGGRSAAWLAALVFAVMPYAVRYSTENRMYSLMMVWGLAAWLLGQRALRKPDWPTLAGLSLVVAGMLWTHYWGLWFGGAGAVSLLWLWRDARRRSDAEAAARALRVLGSLAVGFVLFLPWVPSLLYQAAHTGTPWARRSWPTTVVAFTIQDIGGGGKADAHLFGWSVVIVALLGLMATGLDRHRLVVDVRGLPGPRQVAVLAGLTLLLAMVVGIVTNSAFQPRYNAVWLPLLLVLTGCGLAQLRSPAIQRGLLAAMLVLAVPGVGRSVLEARTQAGAAAKVIERRAAPQSVVVVCPDQLGPSLLRALAQRGVDVGDSPGEGLRVIAYPGFDTPERIDWVDYEKNLRRISPRAYAREVSDRFPSESLFVAWDGTYRTHSKLCESFVHELNALRGGSRAVLTNSAKVYEHEWIVEFGPVKAP